MNVSQTSLICHYQECENSTLCDQCNLKYDPGEEESKGQDHNCFEYMKTYIAQKNMESRAKASEFDTIQKINLDLASKLAEERKNYKELIKSKGRVCNFCEKPIEFS